MGEKKYPVTKTEGLRQRGKNIFTEEHYLISNKEKSFTFQILFSTTQI
jgi:hypothetical protein